MSRKKKGTIKKKWHVGVTNQTLEAACLVICDLEEVVSITAAEFIFDVDRNRKLSRRCDPPSDAEPQTFRFLLQPIQGQEVPQIAPFRV